MYIYCFIFLCQYNTTNYCKTRHTSCCILFNSLCIDLVKNSHKNKVRLRVKEPIRLFHSLLRITYKYFSVLSDKCAHLCVFLYNSGKKISKTAFSILSSTPKTGEFCFCWLRRRYLSHFSLHNILLIIQRFVCSRHLKSNVSFRHVGPQHHREQLCGLGVRGSPSAGYVSGWWRLQDSEPAEETAESCHPAVLHQRGSFHHIWSGSLCGPHRLRLHLDCALAGGWRCRSRSLSLPYR